MENNDVVEPIDEFGFEHLLRLFQQPITHRFELVLA